MTVKKRRESRSKLKSIGKFILLYYPVMDIGKTIFECELVFPPQHKIGLKMLRQIKEKPKNNYPYYKGYVKPELPF